MKNLIRILLLGILALMVTFCQLNKPSGETDNDAFAAYIQGHTAGVISGGENIRIYMAQALTGIEAGDELPAKLLTFTPGVSGKTWYMKDGLIEFQPDERLNNGEEYQVNFSLGKLYQLPKEMRDFKFSFEVLPLDFSVQKASVSISGENGDEIEVSGRIRTSDFLEKDVLEDCFSIESPKGSPALTLEEVGENVFTYRINSLSRLDDNYSIKLVWNGRTHRIDQKGGLDITIPGRNQFEILNVVVEQGADQHIRIDFSSAVDPQQDLEGLIYLAGLDNIRLRRSANQVFLYPLTRISGEWDLNLEGSLRNAAGKNLGEKQIYTLAMDALPPQVQFLGSGYILPNSEGLYLPFRAVSLRAVDLYVYKIFSNNIPQFLQNNQAASNYSIRGSIKFVGRPVFRKTIRLDEDPAVNLNQWNTFSFDLGQLLQEDPHALYHIEVRIRSVLASFGCGGQAANTDLAQYMLPESFSEDDLKAWQDGEYYYEDLYPDDYDWSERDNPCNPSYYTPNKFIYRNVLATNLGVMAKSSDQRNFMVAVTDLLTAKEISNATVEFYTFQQQQILSTSTDVNGLAEITLPETPYLLVVSKDEQRAYLRVDDGSSLSVSNFDVAGQPVQKGFKGFIYGERGVWRPGDTLHLTFALFDKDDILPDDMPVILELYNSRGQLAHKSINSTGHNGFYVFEAPTGTDAATGSWRAVVKVGGAEFSKSVRVETVKPNRLKIKLDFNIKLLSSSDATQTLHFKSTWLHGADAANLRAEVQMRLVEGKALFKGYENFSFTDPVRKFWATDNYLFGGQLNVRGEADIPLDLTINQEAPGMLKAVFISRVYEKGGDFSTDVYTVPYSPYQRYVGISARGLNDADKALVTDTLHKVEVVTVDQDGHPLSVNGLIARVYKIGWRWWWSSGQEDLASYVGSRHENLVSETVLSTIRGKGTFSFKVDYPGWGRYLLHVEDPYGGHSAGQIIYIDWPSWVNRSGRTNPAGATMLSFSADKDSYLPGEKAVLTFPSMENSRALLTIESGSKILLHKWVRGKKSETRAEIDITAEMAPNVYASISLIQPHEHESNDLPIRQYGVIPLKIENPDSQLDPKITLPDEIRPNKSYTVEVSESKGKAMSYTLAVVDEGLLDLTRYKTPDPWSVFYAREALGVKSWDLYDDVIGAYGGRMESLLAVGGDEGELAEGAKKANRFQSVVSFLGPFDLKKGKTARHKLDMPNYIGSVRAMVVAGSGSAWGSAEATVPVRQPLMVLTTLPRVLSPGESLVLPVNLFVMKDKLPDVNLRVVTEGPVHCVGESARTVAVNGLGEQMVYFQLKTSDEPGVAKIRVIAETGKESASHETEVDVRNPNSYTYKNELVVIEPGESADVGVNFHGMSGTNSGTLDIAKLPPFNLERNLQYLIHYPYGCVEQTTSSAFVQLFLDRFLELSSDNQSKADRNIRTAIKHLAGFQLPVGGLSFWPGGEKVNLWGTTYACHFMLEAEREGYSLPYGLRDKILNYQKKTASQYNGRDDYSGDNDLQQAYRLYTLALAGEANQSAMNRLRETATLSTAAAWRLAAAYAQSGRKEVALAILQTAKTQSSTSYSRPGSTFGSTLRDRAMMVETLLLTDQEKEAYRLVESISKELESQDWSTQSTAFGLLALARFVGKSSSEDLLKCTIFMAGKKDKVQTNKSMYRIELIEDQGNAVYHIDNGNEAKLYVTLTTYGQSEPGTEESASSDLDVSVWFRDLGDTPIDESEIKQGTSFKAVVRVSNPAVNGRCENMALSQIFPSGWEILNTRYAGAGPSDDESTYDYRDIRDDRVNTFFSLAPGKSAVFTIRLNAAYQGRYYLPVLSCENMYRRDIYARVKGQWVEVK